MHCSRVLQDVQMPSLLTHRISNFQNIDARTLFGPESDNGRRRVTENVKFRDLSLDGANYLPSGSNDVLS